MTELLGRLLAEIKEDNTSEGRRLLLASSAAERVAAMHLLLDDLLDQITDFEYERPAGSFLLACAEAAERLAGDDGEVPFAALLGFLRLNVKLLERRFESPDRERQDEADAYCRALLAEAPVWKAIRELYRPGGRPGSTYAPSPIEVESWARLDFATCAYHRAGTTSLILRIRTLAPVDESGLVPDLVLKCVLFPWSRLAAVAHATDDYAATYGGARTPAVVVHPQASTDQWVLMPFQPGQTLGEHLRDFEASEAARSPGARARKARAIGLALADALHELARREPVDPAHRDRQHLDLSPSNIIIDARRSIEVRFIDLGVNHLYSRQIGIAEHDDAVYIAPEIKNRGESATADVYSLGIILSEILAGSPPRDGRVPDRVYEISPTVGRFLDDLIDENPRHRLLLLPEGPFAFDALARALEHTFEMANAESETSPSMARRWFARLVPTSREFKTQWQQLRVARAAGADLDRYLVSFSLLMTVCWWWIFAATALFKLDDVITFQWDQLPTGLELIGGIVAFCQALTGAKFYSMVLARLSARRIPGVLARATEVAIRAMSVVALPTVVLAVYWNPASWAWAVALGAVAVSVTNLLLLLLCTRIFEAGAAAGLSTVPPEGRRIPRGFEQWWWTMLLYATLIATIAAGLQTGRLHDRDAYVLGLVLISVGIHYLSKFVGAGYGVRAGLARALAIGERIAVVQRRDHADLPDWPPRADLGSLLSADRAR